MVACRRKIFFLLICASWLFANTAMQAYGTPMITSGGLLQFDNKAEFLMAFPHLTVEDFEESTIADNSVALFPGPLQSNSSNAYFSPGDIEQGLSVNTVTTSQPTKNLTVAGGSYLGWGNTSKIVGSTYTADNLSIEFSEGVNAAGMQLMNINIAQDATIKIYGQGDVLLDTILFSIGTTETFFGIYSENSIVKITVENSSRYEMVDDILFGALEPLTFYSDQAVFEKKHPGLPKEDFEESPIADNSYNFLPEPLDSSTNIPGSFLPGDIIDGLAIGTVTKPGGNSLGIAGANSALYGNQSVIVATYSTSFDLSVSFTNYNAYAVGMDLMTTGGDDETIIIYGPQNTILGATTVMVPATETFFGVFANQPVTRIEVLNSLRLEFVDNIQFGGYPEGLTFYDSRTVFEQGILPLKYEDFEESPVLDTVSVSCDEPLNSSTNNSCFATGDIQTGLSFSTVNSALCPSCMVVYGANYLCLLPQITIRTPGDNLKIDFTGNVNYVGFHAYNNAFFVDIYGKNNTLLGTSYIPQYQCAGGFWGVKSEKTISKIVLGRSPEIIYLDYVLFGSKFPWAMFIPAIHKKSY